MRLQSGVTAAAWIAAALYLLPVDQGWADDVSRQDELSAVNGFPPAIAPAPFFPDDAPGPGWRYSPDGGSDAWRKSWQPNNRPPFWPPRYGAGSWPRYDYRRDYGQSYDGWRYHGPQVGGTTPPSAAPRRPRSIRPYWAGPRWQPRNSPYAWNNNGFGNRPYYRSGPTGRRADGDSRDFGNGSRWQPPSVPRQWRRLPGPSPYGYADAR